MLEEKKYSEMVKNSLKGAVGLCGSYQQVLYALILNLM